MRRIININSPKYLQENRKKVIVANSFYELSISLIKAIPKKETRDKYLSLI